MKKFLIRLLVGLLLIVLLDFVTGSALKYYYFKQDSGFQYRTTHSLNYADDEMMIFGSSRANHHYNPEVFESKLNVSCYNTGRDGTYFFYQTALLRTIIKRHLPKIIIYDFYGSFEHIQSDYDRLSSLLPYYDEHKEIREILELKGPYERFKTLSKTYPYNSLLFNIIMGNMASNMDKNKDIKGYVPLHGFWSNTLRPHKTASKYHSDKNKLKSFQDFIKLCKENSIELYVVASPVFYEYETDYSIATCKEICSEQNIPFYDYTKKEEFLKKPEWFADILHLNEDGAKRFSNIIADSLRATRGNFR